MAESEQKNLQLAGINDIPSAAKKTKPTVLNETSLEEMLQETKESLSSFIKLHKTIQENQNLHNKEVEKAYNAAQKDLDAWKLSSLDEINTRYSSWSVQCGTITKHLHKQAGEMEQIIQVSKDLLSSKDVGILQGCTDFTKALDGQLSEKTAALEKHEVNRQTLSDSVQRDLVVPRQVTVKETAQESHDVKAAFGGQLTSLRVTKPTLKFTDTNDSRLRITDDCSVVETEDLSRGSGCWAVTDGRWWAGRYYWELQITCSPGCDCRAGVLPDSFGPRADANPGWITVMISDYGRQIKPDYGHWRPHKRTRHVGLYLDWDQRSLTLLDCDHNRVIAVRGLEVTRPLVPWVWFSDGKSVSVRLVTGDSATLPQVLCDRLNIS